jgi:hypothetical protein
MYYDYDIYVKQCVFQHYSMKIATSFKRINLTNLLFISLFLINIYSKCIRIVIYVFFSAGRDLMKMLVIIKIF